MTLPLSVQGRFEGVTFVFHVSLRLEARLLNQGRPLPVIAPSYSLVFKFVFVRSFFVSSAL